MSILALNRQLEPLMRYLHMDGVTEICINREHEIYIEKNSVFTRHEVKELSHNAINYLVSLVAEYNHKPYPYPLIAGKLPTGERVQFVMSPVSENGMIVGSIRRHQLRKMTLEDYRNRGAFDEISMHQPIDLPLDNLLNDLYHKKDTLGFLKTAIQAKKNIIISGGTGTGKTTFLNACLQLIPAEERLITIEDTREVMTIQPNVIHLLFNEDDSRMTAIKIFQACLRLRPDRLFLSELRGIEAWPFLRAANSGHPGSLSTVHADTPQGCFDQLVFMMQQAGSTTNDERIRSYIKSIVPIVVQLKRDPTKKRFMYVSEIYFRGVSAP